MAQRRFLGTVNVAANRHPGQVGHTAHPQEEIRDEEPLFEQEQARKVKTRSRMLQHAQKISHNVSQTCRFFPG